MDIIHWITSNHANHPSPIKKGDLDLINPMSLNLIFKNLCVCDYHCDDHNLIMVLLFVLHFLYG